jgi:hypothetical protein
MAETRIGGRGAVLASATIMALVAVVVAAAEVTFDLRLQDGRLSPAVRVIRVQQGDLVRLRWSTNRPIVLHLHGYDIETRVEPGAIAEMTFAARAAGRFSVEPHMPQGGGGHSHGSIIVRIEVHPR